MIYVLYVLTGLVALALVLVVAGVIMDGRDRNDNDDHFQ